MDQEQTENAEEIQYESEVDELPNCPISIPQRGSGRAASAPVTHSFLTTEIEASNRVCTNDEDCPDNPFGGNQSISDSLYLSDGKRSIDFVLVWRKQPDGGKQDERREIFERNLIEEGLEVEKDSMGDFYFLKIHAPSEILCRYAEILKFRMPIKEMPNNLVKSRSNFMRQYIYRLFHISNKVFPKRSQRFTAIYRRNYEYLFDVKNPNFFTSGLRSRIVHFILERKKYVPPGFKDKQSFGIQRLIADKTYMAAFPLHDGDIDVEGSNRYSLYHEWASISKFYKLQPLDSIKEYFGVKIGLYFAWLGFYTYMLIFASIVGLLCFIFAVVKLKDQTVIDEICSKKPKIQLCPLCDYWCDYWDLSEQCFYAKITYLINNSATVFFAIFMSFWAALFLELWKRYAAEITHRWDLTGFDQDEEHPRPEYLARLNEVGIPDTYEYSCSSEPFVPYWQKKLPISFFTNSVVILMISLAFAAVMGIILYRIAILTVLSAHDDIFTASDASLITSVTAATINLLLIFIFNRLYVHLAEYLTNMELLRTQTEYENSLALKIYLLQFVNYYSSLFYIAFFKGKFTGYPGDYNRLFGYRQEECELGGCFMKLCVQLSVIMVGKQIKNQFTEMIFPKVRKWINTFQLIKNGSPVFGLKKQRWFLDLKLIELNAKVLFSEYLEMVIQFGFVTIFVAAFPLAPLFALINNVFELRFDAKKLLKYYRRPVAQRVKDIGVWYKILDVIGKLSVITNGFIIAFTTDFVPRLVYRSIVSEDGSLHGYVNFTLSYFDTQHFRNLSRPRNSEEDVSLCRYQDFREPPWSDHPYEKTKIYWIIFAGRLMFIVIFENIVALVMILIRALIPNVSASLKHRIRQENCMISDIIIREEALRKTAFGRRKWKSKIKPKGILNSGEIDHSKILIQNIDGSSETAILETIDEMKQKIL